MSVLQAEVYESFRSIDVPDDKALKAAVALSAALGKVEDETARAFNKGDADIDATRKDVQFLTVDMATAKRMLGLVLVMNAAMLFKLFGH